MDEELHRLVTTGLLGLIVLLLIVAIARLGRLQRGRNYAAEASLAQPATHFPLGEETGGLDAAPGELAAGHTPTKQEAAAHPEDSPFERDGRWWYWRDDELLVYDERVEQWVTPDEPPAPIEAATTGSTPVSAAPIPEPVSAPGPITGEATPQADPIPAAPEEGTHWKCPACGVINGSTATTCRMCFGARP